MKRLKHAVAHGNKEADGDEPKNAAVTGSWRSVSCATRLTTCQASVSGPFLFEMALLM